eukprot:gene42424-52611_t
MGLKHNGGLVAAYQGNTMTLEAVLAALHLLAILTLVVFLTSEAALCRSEWMNAAVVKRLARLDLIYGITAVVLLATGLARLYLGVKGLSWYVSQPLFHIKITLFVLMGLISIKPTLTFRRWLKVLNSTGALPGEAEVRSTRRWVMVQSHILPVVAVIAVFWARGW